MHFQWRGVFPALTTQFTTNDELDMNLFSKSLQSQIDAGMNGIIIGGSLGEASTLTTAEKETLVKFSLQKAPFIAANMANDHALEKQMPDAVQRPKRAA